MTGNLSNLSPDYKRQTKMKKQNKPEENWKIETMKNQINLLKENKKLDGTITRNEIHDLERSIKLIEYGQDEARKEFEEIINSFQGKEYTDIEIWKDIKEELKKQLKEKQK